MITEWQYHQAIQAITAAERRYAQLLSCVTLLNEAHLRGDKDKETFFQKKLEETLQRHIEELKQ